MSWLTSFADELEKIAISKGRMMVPKARQGRRSMSVDTLLRKEKDGTLYKQAAEEPIRASCGDELEFKMKRRLERMAARRGEPVGKLAGALTEQANAVYQEVDPKNPTITPKVLTRRGDVPAREDVPGKVGVEFGPDQAGARPAGRGLASEGFNAS